MTQQSAHLFITFCATLLTQVLHAAQAQTDQGSIDRAAVHPHHVTRSLLWTDAEAEAWLSVDKSGSLHGDLQIHCRKGWAATWSSTTLGDMELRLRFDQGRLRLLAWAWSETWRGHHLGLVRSIKRTAKQWQLAIDLEREFPYTYYNPQRVKKVVPAAHLIVTLPLAEAGGFLPGQWELHQGGYRHGVYASNGAATAEMQAHWPTQAKQASWPHAGPRPRLGTASDAIDCKEQLRWLHQIWQHHDWTPWDPESDTDPTEKSDAYKQADMELQRLWSLPQQGELLNEVVTSAVIIDRLWQQLDDSQRIQCRTWLMRNAEWAYVRSLEFPAASPWAGHYLATAALCLCVVHGDTGPLQRQSFASILVPKVAIIPPPPLDKPQDGPHIAIPAAHSFTDWVIAGPVPGREHSQLLGENGPGLQVFSEGDSISLAGQTYRFRRSSDKDLLTTATSPMLDAGRLVNDKRDHTAILATMVRAPVRGIVSFRLKVPGGQAWLAGVPVANDQRVRLEAGAYPFVVQAPIGAFIGPGKRRFGATIKIVPQPDHERIHEPYRQYLERKQVLTEPYLLAPRIEDGLRRYLHEAIGENGTIRCYAMDEQLLAENTEDVSLRFVLPAIAAWRQSFGRDLASADRCKKLAQSYFRHCHIHGRPISRDVLLGLHLTGLATGGHPTGMTVMTDSSAIGSGLPDRWHQQFTINPASPSNLSTGLHVDQTTGIATYCTADIGLSLNALHDAGLDSPPLAGHIHLRAWGHQLLTSLPASGQWLGHTYRGNRPNLAESFPFIGGQLLRADRQNGGCQISCRLPMLKAGTQDAWAADGQSIGFLTNPRIDGRDRFILDAFETIGSIKRQLNVMHDDASLALIAQDVASLQQATTATRIVLTTQLGPWTKVTDALWSSCHADGHCLYVHAPGAHVDEQPMTQAADYFSLPLQLGRQGRWSLVAGKDASFEELMKKWPAAQAGTEGKD